MKKSEYKVDFVVRLLNVKNSKTRDVVIHVIAVPGSLSTFYAAAFQAQQNKAKSNEVVIRVSIKGYS